MLEKRTRYAETLLLTAGHIGSSLFDMCVITIGKASDKLICLRCSARICKLFIGSIAVSPPQILRDCPGEQFVLLKHNGYRVSQSLNIIISYINAADTYTAFGNVIEARYELDKSCFRRTRAAKNTDRHAACDMEVYIVERVPQSLVGVLERDVAELYAAVPDIHNRVLRIAYRRLLINHLNDTFHRLNRHCYHNVYP